MISRLLSPAESVAVPGDAPSKAAIVRTLALAAAAGIPVAAPLRLRLPRWHPDIDGRSLAGWLEAHLGDFTGPTENSREWIPGDAGFGATAFVHLRDGLLRDEDLVLGLEPMSAALCDELSHHCLARMAILHDIATDPVLELVVRLSPAGWLARGATLHFADCSVGRERRRIAVVLDPAAGLDLASRTPLAGILAERLAALWDHDFDAVLAEFEGEVRLIDLSVSKAAAAANGRRLADLGDDALAGAGDLIANFRPSFTAIIDDGRAALGHGHGQGDRMTSGPLVGDLAAAAAYTRSGRPPIIAIDSLMPAAARGLEGCAGLVLGRDGPASHIAVLARNLGLAVLTGVGPISWTGQHCRLGKAKLLAGDLVSMVEADGGLYAGALPVTASPAAPLAARLDRLAPLPVAVAIGSGAPAVHGRRIGLCRSELQALGASADGAFPAYLRMIAAGINGMTVPELVQSALRDGLTKVLDGADGALVNYRLIDAELGEMAAMSPGDDAVTSVRGPRWALASGFYGWQIAMAVEEAARSVARGRVDLVITLPSAFSIEEVCAVRALFDAERDRWPSARGSIRFGVMLETPRLCAFATALAGVADVVSFGTNDLTASIHHLERDAWSRFGNDYRCRWPGMTDPFAELDLAGVAPLVAATIKRLRAAGFTGLVLLCGEPAASEAAHRRFADYDGLIFSVTEGGWAGAALSCARERARGDGLIGFDRTPAAAETAAALGSLRAALATGRTGVARNVAMNWLGRLCPFTGSVGSSGNWKMLKKRLAANLFGGIDGHFLPPPWTAEEVVVLAGSMAGSGSPLRLSIFPPDISCHAESRVIDGLSLVEFKNLLEAVDPGATLNLFPQQSADQLCFRVLFAEGAIIVEAGWGQAMYVFEAERGQHPILVSRATNAEQLAAPSSVQPTDQLAADFVSFITTQRDWLQGVHCLLRSMIGGEAVAIEGYFDAPSGRRVVVDIDLPLDLAWNDAEG